MCSALGGAGGVEEVRVTGYPVPSGATGGPPQEFCPKRPRLLDQPSIQALLLQKKETTKLESAQGAAASRSEPKKRAQKLLFSKATPLSVLKKVAIAPCYYIVKAAITLIHGARKYQRDMRELANIVVRPRAKGNIFVNPMAGKVGGPGGPIVGPKSNQVAPEEPKELKEVGIEGLKAKGEVLIPRVTVDSATKAAIDSDAARRLLDQANENAEKIIGKEPGDVISELKALLEENKEKSPLQIESHPIDIRSRFLQDEYVLNICSILVSKEDWRNKCSPEDVGEINKIVDSYFGSDTHSGTHRGVHKAFPQYKKLERLGEAIREKLVNVPGSDVLPTSPKPAAWGHDRFAPIVPGEKNLDDYMKQMNEMRKEQVRSSHPKRENE